MRTTTKRDIWMCITCAIGWLNIFSGKLKLPEALKWFFLVGIFVPIGMIFYYNKKIKSEIESGALPKVTPDIVKNRLKLALVFAFFLSFSSPFWIPLTGPSLGFGMDLAMGLLSFAIVGTIIGIRIRKLSKEAEQDAAKGPSTAVRQP